MPDIIDEANETAANFVSDNENYIRGLVPAEKHKITEDDLTCIQCEEPNSIPEARALKGYTTCVSCASWAEKFNKRQDKRSRYEDD